MKHGGFLPWVFAAVLVAVIAAPNQALAFRAPSEKPAIRKEDKAGDRVTKPGKYESVPGLKTIVLRDLELPAKGDAEKAAITSVDDLMRSAKSKAVVRKTQIDKLGYKHIRLRQRYQGLPVVGAELIVHIDDRGVIYRINGKYLPDSTVSVEPKIDAQSALQIGLDEQKGKTALRVSKEPSLVIYGPHLAYHYIVSHKGESPGQWWYYVDAHTGELLQRYNNIKFGAPTGVGTPEGVTGSRLTGEDGSVVAMTGWKEDAANYFLYNYEDLWGVYDEAAADWEQQATSDWGTLDRAAISLAHNISLVQDWVRSAVEIYSFDDAGAFARANAHVPFIAYDGCNASWDGENFDFGDGNGTIAAPLTVLDVVAHEYGHAITDYASELIYAYEPGALNESYSDIMGVAVEFAMQPDGRESYPTANPGYADWLLGEDAWLAAEALRDMRDPQRFGQPSYYHGTLWYDGPDNGVYVHRNSGVQNFAFYLLSEGGTGFNDGHYYDIRGIGLAAATDIAMRANMYYLTDVAEYRNSRNAWVSAATDLGYPTATVKYAWIAVGISTNYVPDDFLTIQDALDAAVDGDIIVVHDGTYSGVGNYMLDFKGKATTLRSENGPENCVIDGSGNYGFHFYRGEGYDSVVDGFTVTNGSGGIRCDYYSSPTIRNCIITGNSGSSEAAGIICANDSSPTIIGCTISGNTGRGVYCWDSSPIITNCTISENGGDWGGAIHCDFGSSPIIENCIIENNSRVHQYSGGITCTGGAPIITNCRISGNTSLDSTGGGIDIRGFYGTAPVIKNCIIISELHRIRWGGISCLSSSATITGCTISDNFATRGGGVYSAGATITNCTISQNWAAEGGGVFSDGVAIFNCTVSENTAESDGGGIYSNTSHLTVTGSTISGNEALIGYGGGIYNSMPAYTQITTSILWGDSAPHGSEIALACTEPRVDVFIAYYSDVQGGQEGVYADPDCGMGWDDSNINADPLFVGGGDYHLIATSPCIDAGGSPWPWPDPPRDIDGDNRPNGSESDMGSDEYYGDVPRIGVNPTILSNFCQHGSDAPDQSFEVWNAGHGSLSFSISDDADWLHCNPASGTASAEPEAITVHYSASGLEPGNYSATITISDVNASNDPQNVEVSLNVRAGVYYVPDDYPTIQDALDACKRGDEIVVRDGTYTGQDSRNLNFKGKAMTLRSENGPESCIIDCQGDAVGFFFNSGETEHSILDGFTIINGNRPLGYNGGGIYCYASSPTIMNCIISGNSAETGGGIHCTYFSSPILINCTISGNSAAVGGGIFVFMASFTARNCIITGNSAENGGGAYFLLSSPSTITNCTISGNTALSGGGLQCTGSSLNITNCILWNDLADTGPEIHVLSDDENPASLTVGYSDVEGGQAAITAVGPYSLNWMGGNLDSDPLFVAPGYWTGDEWIAGNYHLDPCSPAIDAGDPASGYLNEPEPNGNRINMGAYGNTSEATPSTAGDEATDDDGDTYSECQGDCDDGDPNNYPDNQEVCDGQDNNCNDQIDESPEADLSCDDSDACTADLCGSGICFHTPVACDDGLFCNGIETCDSVDGCQPGVPVDCDDGSLCTADTCDENQDVCAYEDVVCDDGDLCTIDGCDPASGCTYEPRDCEDGDLCTTDTCDSGSGECAREPKDCDDGVGCTADSCDAGTGECLHAPDDLLCDDGEFCNGEEYCDAALDCQAGDPPCSPADACNEAMNQCECAALRLQPIDVVVACDTLEVTAQVAIENVTDLNAFDFVLTFDPTVMQVNSCVEGSFLGAAGATGFVANIDNTLGHVSISGSLVDGNLGRTGSGILAELMIQAPADASLPTSLCLDSIVLTNNSGESLCSYTECGSITEPRKGDVDGTGYVDYLDLFDFVFAWGLTCADESYCSINDYNDDCSIHYEDLFDFVFDWHTGAHLIGPDGGEICTGTEEITWEAGTTTEEALLVDLYLSTDGGASWSEIVLDEANDGSYLWDTTAWPDSDQCKLKIVVYNSTETYEDESDGVFTIENL